MPRDATERREIKRVARRVIDGMRPKNELADHYLTNEQLWKIMRICADPKVAKTIRRIP